MKQILRIQDLRRRIESASSEQERICLHLDLAYELRNQDVATAYRLLNDIQALVDARGDEILMAEHSYTRGTVSACNFEYDVSLQSLFAALELFRKNGHIEGEVRSLRWIAITYRNVGMLITGVEYAHQAHAIAQKHDLKNLLGYCATIVGDCYVLLHRHDEGEEYHNKAAQIAHATSDIVLEGQALWSLARLYEQTGRYEAAMQYYKASFDVRMKDGDLLGAGTSEYGMASVAEKQGNTRGALHIYLRLLQSLRTAAFGPRQTEVFILLGIGRLYMKSTKPSRARPYLLLAVQMATAIGTGGNVLISTYFEFASFLKLVGEFQEALTYYEKYHALSQELSQREAQQTSQYFRQAYEFDKARQQNEIYRLRNEELAEANRQNERLLLNVLPEAIAQRMKAGETMIAEYFENVTVLFADIVHFTQLAAKHSPEELVSLLNRIFSAFDIFSEQYNLEKIKTIGDAYMIVGGVPHPSPHHAESVANMALEMLDTIRLLSKSLPHPIDIRIGIHTGAVVAGVIGQKKFSYDLWGDTVNTASRMESHGEAGKIHVSEEVRSALTEKFSFEARGAIEIKGKGTMTTYFLTRRC
ncbi:MAG: hypothetical protein EAZ92_16955 [Candidatus Kapaibacterium sp.]|nr:MAG: hypothetical protein EAZ92_16955 [Candidatus Kapabacteria bacterium]